jgi:MFS family permease
MRHRVRGNVLVLLCGLYFIAYLDRTNIATATPDIKASLHISNTQLGLALAAFSLPYAFLQAFGGWLGDRVGPRTTLAVVGVVWAIATAATGLADGLLTLFAARLVLGIGEGPAFPTATRAMATWVPPDRHGFAQGAVHAASRLGGAVAPLVVAAIIAWRGWRMSFWLIGALSIAWTVVWLLYFRDDPQDHAKVGKLELHELRPDVPVAAHVRTPWRPLLKRMLPVTAIDFCYGWLLWVYLTWLPSYFADNFHLALTKFALFSTFVLLAGVLGDWVGGNVSDALLRRTGNLQAARRWNLRVGLIGSVVFLAPVAFVHVLFADTIFLSVAFFFLELTNPALWALPMDIAPRDAGMASGFMNTGFGLAGVLSPAAFGFLLDRGNGWELPVGLSVALLAVGAILVSWIDPRPITDATVDTTARVRIGTAGA